MPHTMTHQQAKRLVERKLRFFTHLTAYLLINGWFILTHLSHQPGHPWSNGLLFGWGIGVLFHGLSVFLHAPGTAWKQRMIDQERHQNR